MALVGTQWFLFKSGTCATNHFESGGFVKSDPDVLHPDIETQFVPFVMREAGTSQIQHGYQVNYSLTLSSLILSHKPLALGLGGE